MFRVRQLPSIHFLRADHSAPSLLGLRPLPSSGSPFPHLIIKNLKLRRREGFRAAFQQPAPRNELFLPTFAARAIASPRSRGIRPLPSHGEPGTVSLQQNYSPSHTEGTAPALSFWWPNAPPSCGAGFVLPKPTRRGEQRSPAPTNRQAGRPPPNSSLSLVGPHHSSLFIATARFAAGRTRHNRCRQRCCQTRVIDAACPLACPAMRGSAGRSAVPPVHKCLVR